jgi:2'-5' RNA ligase
MVHSIELLFDAETAAAMHRIWTDLHDSGVHSMAASKAPSNRPHVTLTVAQEMDDAVREALVPALRLLPLRCTVGAVMLFGRGPFTLVRLVLPSPELVSLQAQIHDVCLPHMSPGPLPHTDPGQWTPHVTLARRLAADRVPVALSLPRMAQNRQGSFVGIRHWDGKAKREYPI